MGKTAVKELTYFSMRSISIIGDNNHTHLQSEGLRVWFKMTKARLFENIIKPVDGIVYAYTYNGVALYKKVNTWWGTVANH